MKCTCGHSFEPVVEHRHRLLCGDATRPADAARVLAGAKPRMMVTDPPYGVEYDPGWRAGKVDETTGRVRGKCGAGPSALGRVVNDDRSDWREAWALFPGDVAYVWHASWYTDRVASSIDAAGFIRRSLIIWGKTHLQISRGHYHWQHEPCWYAVRKGTTAHWIGGRDQTTLWMIPHVKSETGHSSQKPIEAMARPQRNHAAQEVYDPFLGSGTTMVAAENLGRRCYAIELNPAYIAVTLERMLQGFGLTGERLS